MTEPQRHRTSDPGPYLLAGGALLVVAAVLLCLVPLADCPRCTTWNFFGPFEEWDVRELGTCRVCGGKRSVPLLKKCTWRR